MERIYGEGGVQKQKRDINLSKDSLEEVQMCPNYKMWSTKIDCIPLEPEPRNKIGSCSRWLPLKRILAGAVRRFSIFGYEVKILGPSMLIWGPFGGSENTLKLIRPKRFGCRGVGIDFFSVLHIL